MCNASEFVFKVVEGNQDWEERGWGNLGARGM
jgi:hypothetical protein